MGIRASRVGSAAAVILVIAACGGSGGPSGFTVDSGGGGGGMDGGGGHHDGGINLLGDSGGDSAHGCTGLACNVEACTSGGIAATTVSGTVYAPNGTLPLYDVQVFIPNAALEPFPKGVQCDQCGAPVSGSPITTALSDPTGHFTLTGVPSGSNIPIVVQLGKWRREAYIPTVNSCAENTLTDPDLTRLPKNQMEGSMPHIALTTGECDNMGCMLPKVGIDPIEFGYESDGYNKAINTYVSESEMESGESIPGAAAASDLWGSSTLLNTYDEGIFSCECTEPPEAPAGSAFYTNMTNYLNAGGRIFTTDFMYTWYKYSPDPNLGGGSLSDPDIGIGEIIGGAPLVGEPPDPIDLVTTFPKGLALAQWLKVVFPTGTYAQVVPDVIWGNIQSLNASKTVTWATSPEDDGTEDVGTEDAVVDAGSGSLPRVFTVDTPVGKPTAMQCGRGVHLDAHIDSDQTVGPGYPTSGCGDPLAPAEAMFAFFFFDLSSCIQNEKSAPVPPPPAPK
jgi:hypothetical protein